MLLSVVCLVGLIHVELKIQEHYRLISHTVTFCDKTETEILRKVKQNYGRWQQMASRHWQATKGKFRCHHSLAVFPRTWGAMSRLMSIELTTHVC